jgi:Matrixin
MQESNRTMKLNTTEVRTAIHQSLQQWERISLLTFKEDFYNPNADIKISFMQGDHLMVTALTAEALY